MRRIGLYAKVKQYSSAREWKYTTGNLMEADRIAGQ